MTRHVSADTLASYREGEVGRRKAARIRAHLAGCAVCAGVSSDLDAVSSLLAGVRLPVIPDHLASRLQNALAAESAARATRSPAQAGSDAIAAAGAATATGAASSESIAAGAGATGHATTGAGTPAQVPGRPDLPERARRPQRRRSPWLSSPLVLRTLAAAGAAVILAGGGYLLASGSNARTAASSGAGAKAPLAGPVHSAAVRPVFGLPYSRNGTVHNAIAIHSNINFEPATLGSQIHADLVSSAMAGLGRKVVGTARPSASQAARVQFAGVSVQTLTGCVSLVAAGREVVLVDVARYQGNPATVIVTKRSPAARTLLVTVVGLACSAAHADVITSVTIPAS